MCATGRLIYFAYGLNLDRAEMEHRCPGAFFAGRARLPDHAFQITIEGVATVVRQPGAQVHGAIWHLTDRHLATLDEFEGVEVGFYVRETKEVRQNHRAVKAQVYTATDPRLGRSRPHYLETIIAAATDLGLPEVYMEELRQWLVAGWISRRNSNSRRPA
jgi:gamma-glutamylcyclotransferase (GGCT)/AIG2-like uncharacterized protein YtfP